MRWCRSADVVVTGVQSRLVTGVGVLPLHPQRLGDTLCVCALPRVMSWSRYLVIRLPHTSHLPSGLCLHKERRSLIRRAEWFGNTAPFRLPSRTRRARNKTNARQHGAVYGELSARVRVLARLYTRLSQYCHKTALSSGPRPTSYTYTRIQRGLSHTIMSAAELR
jgi:hypothetical protein